ncbi:MAG: hypothetical protein UT61_C0053G0004 [Candidatus Woesebacteria bacterium GW2011_GWA1_39_8]|uniref:AB hydrolase-1 domain-containing protein n=1 Tax=Candidatus Woesebacteria bacterium GW2011_GWA1_39_8 TaxID=1618552 RepID=A0A0G0PK40_9BACT|nr:MAG: hypothetical protein UT61_C0053G0004 [Candidatus Woesebacteria bacterium GW2011_GWA1_39_8]
MASKDKSKVEVIPLAESKPSSRITEITREVKITTINLIRGFIEPNSPTGFREEIAGKEGSLIIIRGFGKKSSLPETRIKEEMYKLGLSGVITGIAAGPGNEELEKFVAQLISEVEKYDSKPILVGYSLGGLIALLAYHHGIQDKIRGIITVGAPINGIKAVLLLKRKSGLLKEISPGSKFLETLGTKKYHPNTYHLLAEFDQFVGNPSLINIDGKKIILPIRGHNNFLEAQITAQEVAKLAMEMLKNNLA